MRYGSIPVAGDAQTFEFVALDVDPAFGKAAAFLTELDDIDGVLVAALLAVLFLDLPFDGQTVAIPSGDIARVAAHHLLAAHDHVLQDFVQRVPDMQMTVCIRRAIVQREGLARPSAVAQAVVNADLLPAVQPAGFAVGQARAHREIGFRQVQRVFVVRSVGTHGFVSLG